MAAANAAATAPAKQAASQASPQAVPAGKAGAPLPPAGFTQVQSAHRYYWIHESKEGVPNPVQGIVLARFERHDSTAEKPGFFYTMKLTAPTLAVDRDKVVKEMAAGDVVIVDERIQLQGLAGFLTGSDEIEAYVVKKDKIKGGKGNVVLFDIFAKETGRKRMILPGGTKKELPPADDDAAPGADGIPF